MYTVLPDTIADASMVAGVLSDHTLVNLLAFAGERVDSAALSFVRMGSCKKVGQSVPAGAGGAVRVIVTGCPETRGSTGETNARTRVRKQTSGARTIFGY